MTLLHKIRETSSTLAKQQLIKQADDMLQSVFIYAYSPFLTYGVNFGGINWNTVSEPVNSMFDLLDELATRRLSGNAAVDAVIKYAEEHGDLIKLICNKDLDIGASSKTINKAFGKTVVPVFNVQLAQNVDLHDIPLPCVAQLKYNGVRVLAVCGPKSVTLHTRSGLTFDFPELQKELASVYAIYGSVVLDGEICVGDSQASLHTKVSGVINSALKGSPVKTRGLQFHVFDAVPYATFSREGKTSVYKERWGDLTTIVSTLKSDMVYQAKCWDISSHADLQDLFDTTVAENYEGLIVKYWDGLYTYRKNKTWIKLKVTDTADLECYDYIDGTGKYEGGLGALKCRGFVNGKKIEVNVGTGFSDNQRMQFNPDDYVGKIIEVAYNSVIKNTDDNTYSLFLPRFITVRGDLY